MDSKAQAAYALPPALSRAMRASARLILICTLFVWAWDLLGAGAGYGLTDFFFRKQDSAWLLATALCTLVLTRIRLPGTIVRFTGKRLRYPRFALPIMAIAVFLFAASGAGCVLYKFDLSRDEVLADFDAVILRAGMLVAPVEMQWRQFAPALQPLFMVPVPENAGFVSAYLPGNALLRALVGLFADAFYTGPLLAAIAVISTYGVARRLWPKRCDIAIVAALFVATSAQVLVTASSSYAMSAHLALNLIWLWLFLRDDKVGHGAALAVGFLATGLHQIIFHPLFAAPFILRLYFSSRRRVALAYIAGYTIIFLFWISYWHIALYWQGIAPDSASDTGAFYFIVRVATLLKSMQPLDPTLMLKNLLRFFAWQNPLLLPLLLLAWRSAKEGDGVARELAAGVFLTLVAMLVLLPYQGHGWGYRYWHGLIGNLALLAGYGWAAMVSQTTRWAERAAARSVLALTTVLGGFILMAHAKDARDFVKPYFLAEEAIRQSSADIVMVDRRGMAFAQDLVRNDPFLRNRPLVMDIEKVTEQGMNALCSSYKIAVFDISNGSSLGIPLLAGADAAFSQSMIKPRPIPCAIPLDTKRGG